MKWDDLTLQEKGDIMKICIRNGMSNLQDIKAIYNSFAEGGSLDDDLSEVKQDATYVKKPPLQMFTTKDFGWENDALQRTDKVFSNYSEVKDKPLPAILTLGHNFLRFLQDRNLNPFGSGVSNCTLTASKWVDPSNPIKNAASIVNDPGYYKYSPITAEEAVPGNIVIAKHPDKESYHTMMLSGFADTDTVFNFDGKEYPVKKGEPLVTYSRGGHDVSFIRRDIPLSVYTDNSDGKTENYFYRYNYPNEVFLPEVVITPKKKYFKGGLSL